MIASLTQTHPLDSPLLSPLLVRVPRRKLQLRNVHHTSKMQWLKNVSTADAKSAIQRPNQFQPDSLFLEAIQESLDCNNNDEEALFCDLFAGISSAKTKVPYNEKLVENLIRVLELALSQWESSARCNTGDDYYTA
ncbi:hypothetical protein OS493_017850 [Desmophyllum pertusum]|uniref:Uncharacterized protein n=1 Tax=Desmophyllum pertusum TaxID=174260 RepID=A0A9W9Z3K2_9CNID|nr:hypothetical protein OS493_017850 [Desmophyllum pertusum]